MAGKRQIEFHEQTVFGGKPVQINEGELILQGRRAVEALTEAHRVGLRANEVSLPAELLRQQIIACEAISRLRDLAKERPQMLTACQPLLREQVERVFFIAYAVREGEEADLLYTREGWYLDAFQWAVHDIEQARDPGDRAAHQRDGRTIIEDAETKGIAPNELKAVRDNAKKGKVRSPKERFPTPGMIRDRLHDRDVGAVLRRAYVDYRLLCAHTHSGLSRLRLSIELADGRARPQERGPRDAHFHSVLLLARNFLYVALACAVAVPGIPGKEGASPLVADLWAVIVEFDPLAIAYWELGVKDLLAEAQGAAAGRG